MTAPSGIFDATKPSSLALIIGNAKEVPMRGFIIGVLVIGVGVLGYLYWDSQHNTVFKAPGVEIKKN
jgi:hypothetical protein